ncbi:hypothetical protein BDZ97DRAFT_158260 [Flammula alnicola]|nr:hypothetical protein BDZ97DRAFT_158260 [Flammula alnicola]
MFSHANKPTIEGGTFSVVHGDAHFHSHPLDTHAMERGLDTLRQHIAPGAFHNSDERYDPPKCHLRTRQAVLGKIMDWIQDPENLRLFLWLYGPAGAGKSAISQTIAEMCQAAGLLVASFFFSRTAVGRNDRTYLISTLSYQLMLSIPEASDQILAVVERDPSIFTRSLEAQIFALIIDPLKNVSLYERNRESMHLRPKLIIIDGLDECGDTKSQKYVLDVLARCASQLPIPLFFLIASRPEHGIRNAFNAEALNSLTISIALDDSFHPDDDIRTFLESRFQDIRREHPSGSYLSQDWPSKDAVERLLRKSSGQFIYASTVMKYIESHRHRPTGRLDIILGLSSPGNDSPFAELDALYIQILSSVQEVEKVLTIITFIILHSSLPFATRYGMTLSLVENILDYTPGDVHIILCDMHAIIHVPDLFVETDRYRPHRLPEELRLHHASLGDFLLDRSRSKGFFIDAAKGHADLARRRIKYISTLPPDRIAGLLLDYIMEHCTHAYLTQELMNSLFGFNLQAHIADPLCLGDGRKRVEHFGLWHDFLGWLRNTTWIPNIPYINII